MKKRKGKPEPQKYHHGDLRRAIMDAALETIGETGIENLSLREIARRIGVTTAAPYHHFKDRQHLLLDLAIEAYAELLRSLEEARDQARTTKSQIEATVIAYLRFARENRAQYSVMFSGEFYGNPRMGEMMEVANKCLNLVRTSIAESAGLGAKESSAAAFCAWSLLHGILMLDKNGVLQETSSEQESLAIQGSLAIVTGTLNKQDILRQGSS